MVQGESSMNFHERREYRKVPYSGVGDRKEKEKNRNSFPAPARSVAHALKVFN